MFDYEERRKEIKDHMGWSTEELLNNASSEIISQEKSMIEQAKKEAVKEFVEKIWKEELWKDL